jgi:cytochrome c biogenesis protein CcdA
MSLVGALTHLGKVAHHYWIRSVIAYTVAGTISASLVGGLLAWAGSKLCPSGVCWVVIPLALILAARERGWIRFRLPERNRQTEKVWAHEFGFVTASAMWGFHIGLGFTTYVKYGGFWVLTVMAFGTGKPGYGALLMLTYWLGRAMPVWVMPFISHGIQTAELMRAISANRSLYKQSEAFALFGSALAAMWVLHGSLSLPGGSLIGNAP